MPISAEQIIDRSIRVANQTGLDANSSPVIDNSVVFEDLFPLAMREAVSYLAGNPEDASSLKQDHALTFTSGSAPLPAGVVTECLDSSSLNSSTYSGLVSWQPRYIDFIRPVHKQLGYYLISGSNVLFRAPGGAPGTFNGSLTLNAVSVPIPANISDDLAIGEDLANEVIVRLASMVVARVTDTLAEMKREDERKP